MENIDLFQDSLQKLSELKDRVVNAKREYSEELLFCKRLADRSGRNIPDDLMLSDDGGTLDALIIQPSNQGNQVNSAPGLVGKVGAGTIPVKPGEFFPKSLAESVRLILDRAPDNISHWDVIVDALRRGGFPRVRNESEVTTARTNIVKSAVIVLIPDNMFGLTAIYGGKKRAGRKTKEEAAKTE